MTGIGVMLKLKRLVTAMAAIATVCVSIGSLSANATTCIQARKDERLYDNEWERIAYYWGDRWSDNGKINVSMGRMVFGYDMDFFDEVYNWTRGDDASTKPGIRFMYDGEGADYSPAEANYTWGSYKDIGKYSKLERKYECRWNRFAISFDNTYTNITSNVDNTSSDKIKVATPVTETE